MIKLEKYTGTKNYFAISGKLMTPDEVYKRSPAAKDFPFVVETDPNGEIIYALNPLASLRNTYNIDSSLNEDEAIAAIEAIRNTPPAEPDPSAEERIAAALEYQNLINS